MGLGVYICVMAFFGALGVYVIVIWLVERHINAQSPLIAEHDTDIVPIQKLDSLGENNYMKLGFFLMLVNLPIYILSLILATEYGTSNALTADEWTFSVIVMILVHVIMVGQIVAVYRVCERNHASYVALE